MKKILISSLMVFGFAAAMNAQTATPKIDAREAKQQERIENGVKTGELNKRETRRLEKQEGHIQNAEAKAKSDGVVTPEERAKLKHMENKTSRHIKNQKHDAQKKN